jgi:polyhydroxyalkanoate synthesis regulator phasin
MAVTPDTPSPLDDAILAAIAALRTDLIAQIARSDSELSGQITDQITQLRTELTGAMTKLRVDLSARLDAQGNRLTSIQEEIGVAMAGTDHAVRLNKNTREEHLALTEQVSALTRLVRTLSTRLAAIEDKPSEAKG